MIANLPFATTTTVLIVILLSMLAMAPSSLAFMMKGQAAQVLQKDFKLGAAAAAIRVSPDFALKTRTIFPGNVDCFFSARNDSVMYAVSSGYNQVMKIEIAGSIETFRFDVSNSGVKSLGVTERCVNGMQFEDKLVLIYASVPSQFVFRSFIVVIDLKDPTQVQSVKPLGGLNSLLVDSLMNTDMNLIHAIIRQRDRILVITFDPRDSSFTETNALSTMDMGKLAYTQELGLLAVASNSSATYAFFLDANELTILHTINDFQQPMCSFESLSAFQTDVYLAGTGTNFCTTITNKFSIDTKQWVIQGIASSAYPLFLRIENYGKFSVDRFNQVDYLEVGSEIVVQNIGRKTDDKRYELVSSSGQPMIFPSKLIVRDETSRQYLAVPGSFFDEQAMYQISFYNIENFKK